MESQINCIRNILRKEGITGIESINHCIVFIISRMLTKQLCKKLNINNKYSFNEIIKDNDGEELGNTVFNSKIYKKGLYDCLIGQMKQKLNFLNILFNKMGEKNLNLIYQSLAKIDITSLDKEYDIIGTIYELHLKSGTSTSMRDLGQYYTHRKVIKYMIELCKPTVKNGIVEKILDPTMGTGGFLTMAIKYLNNNSTEKIDWKKNKDNIIGFDIDDNVTNMARLNVLLETGELCTDTIVKQDTLHEDLKLPSGEILQKANVILANEPMGIKGLIHKECCKRIKNLNIRGTKAEPLFLQLFMEALNKDGRCAVIVPDGVLFTESFLHKETRKHLIENFNLKKVISLQDKDFFMNTGVKTSILYFENNGKTKEVEFCEIKLVDGNIKEESVLKAKYKELIEKNYSLFVNKFKVEVKEDYGEVKWMKLKNLYDFLPTTKHTSSIGKKNGKYRFYNSSQNDKFYLDHYEVEDKSIIIGNGGSICIHIDQKFTPSKHVTVFKNKSINIINEYIYYYLTINRKMLEELSAGSTIKWLNKTNIGNLQIPVPSLTLQQKIVKKLDILSSNIENSKKMIKEQKDIMKMYIEMETMDGEEVKLGDVIDINYGTRIKRNEVEKKNGLFGCYGGGNLVFYMNKFNREGKTIVISRFGVSQNCVRIINDKFWLNDSGMSITSNNKKILTNNFLGHSTINLLKEQIYSISVGACQKNVNIDDFKNLKLLLLSLNKQKEIVSYCDNIQNTIDKLEKHIEDNKQLMKNLMEEYLKKATDKKEETKQKSKPELEDDDNNETDCPLSKDDLIRILYTRRFGEKGNVKYKDLAKKYNLEKSVVIQYGIQFGGLLTGKNNINNAEALVKEVFKEFSKADEEEFSKYLKPKKVIGKNKSV